MSQKIFGSGSMWGIPLTDAAGAAITIPTPIQFGFLQDVSIDISFETKLLHGSYQFPVAVGRGKGKISGKAKQAKINGNLFNSLFFGQTVAAGIVSDYDDVTGAAIPTTPFTITPTPPSSGTWSVDLGVKNASGNPMTRVSGTPTTGQYAVTAGAYLFASADTGLTVFISYQYTATGATTKKSTVQNQLMGYAPSFRAEIYCPFEGKSLILTFPKAIASKLAIATKLDDFVIPEMEFECFSDDSGNVMYWATTE
jgi:hypothetical protein